MTSLVYALCAVTCAICAGLLLRGYVRSHARLLLWSGLCFVGLFLNNAILFIDMRVVPQLDLSVWRTIPALAGVALLVSGLVWESRN